MQLLDDYSDFEWFRYSGSNIETTRPFCLACTKKRYIHRSEFVNVIKGSFKEYKEVGGKVDPKTGLAKCISKKTTVDNFIQLRGGKGCMHQLRPVTEDLVPEELLSYVYSSAEYQTWKLVNS